MKMSNKIYTIEQFSEALKRMENAARGKALLNSADAGARTIETYAKINIEKTFRQHKGESESLSGSILRDIVSQSDTLVEIAVGPSVIYGRIQELGGTVKPVFKKWLHWVDEDGQHHQAKEVTLPARPYLRPAVDENGDKIVKAISENLRIEIENAL